MIFDKRPDDRLSKAARAALLSSATLEELSIELRSRVFMLTGEESVLGRDEPVLDTPEAPEGIEGDPPTEADVIAAIERGIARATSGA